MNGQGKPVSSAPATRWLPRFGLRTLLILVALFGVTFGYLGHLYRRVAHQRYIVAKIQEAGGTVRYNWQLGMGAYLEPMTDTEALVTKLEDLPDGRHKMTRVTRNGAVEQTEESPGPWLLRKLLGEDAFAYVESVDFNSSSHPIEPFDPRLLLDLPELKVVQIVDRQVSNEWLKFIAQIPQLRVLNIYANSDASATADGLALLATAKHLESVGMSGDGLSDEAFARLGELRQLKLLYIGSAPNVTSAIFSHVGELVGLQELDIIRCKQINDEGTEHLSKLRNLKVLQLINTSISDPTLVHIANLDELKWLILCQTNTGDRGVQKLGNLSKITFLNLSNTQVTDASGEAISRLSNLRRLDLVSTSVTNQFLAHLTSLSQLEELDLPRTAITDDGLPYLRTLTNLKRLTLGVNVTKSAAEKLQESLPECKIIGFGANGSSNFHLFPARRP